jgi:hypothetical protein
MTELSHAKQSETLCRCGKENRQAGQRYGKRCHADAQQRYRDRQAAKRAADHRAHLALIAASVANLCSMTNSTKQGEGR